MDFVVVLEIVSALLVFASFCAYSAWDGKRDGYYFYLQMFATDQHRKAIKNDISNIHEVFTMCRFFVGVICATFFLQMTLILGYSWIQILTKTALFGFSLVCAFSFWHNGYYFMKRNDLDHNLYALRFKSDSATSTSTIDLDWPQRKNLFVIAIIFLIASIWIR